MNPLRIIVMILVLCAAASVRAEAGLTDGLPPVAEVQREAIKFARYDVAEISSWVRKSRLAALVPRVQFDFGKHLRDNIDIGIQDNVYVGSSGIVVGPEEGDYTNVHTSDITIGMRAVWEFGDAVFSPKQLAVSAEARRAVHDRNLLMADVNRHYYNVAGFADEADLMRRSPVAAKKPEFVELKVYQRMISCRESAAQLDALTGGWFTGGVADRDALCRDKTRTRRGGRS